MPDASPNWRGELKWRRALWQGMARLGLTGLHPLPVHRPWVDLHRRVVKLPGLDRAFDGYKIAHVSDLHHSPVVSRRYLRVALRFVADARPDVVAITGDFITGGHRYAETVAEVVGELRAPDGVLATFGNHDYTMFGRNRSPKGRQVADRLERALRNVGVRVLRNDRWCAERAGARLTFVGVDDDWSGHADPDRAFAGVNGDGPTICLSHNPAYARALLDYPWHLMLSGHTHGRAIDKPNVVQKLVKTRPREFVRGHYELDGRHLYVNRGLSYGQRRHRVTRPEVTVFKLRPV